MKDKKRKVTLSSRIDKDVYDVLEDMELNKSKLVNDLLASFIKVLLTKAPSKQDKVIRVYAK